MGRFYSYKAPRSRVIERSCTKSFAHSLVRNGVHPAGSIWCPGPIDDRPDIGALFGPDPKWKRPELIRTLAEEQGRDDPGVNRGAGAETEQPAWQYADL